MSSVYIINSVPCNKMTSKQIRMIGGYCFHRLKAATLFRLKSTMLEYSNFLAVGVYVDVN